MRFVFIACVAKRTCRATPLPNFERLRRHWLDRA
jgi:hypothetical protein